jgi:uncharacterized LabA/DUF88 family protein
MIPARDNGMALPQVRSIVLVDGENLVARFQHMVRSGKHWPVHDVVYAPNVLVWHKRLFSMWEVDYFRINYFQSVSGGEDVLNHARETISNIQDDRTRNPYRYCQLTPSIFVKKKREHRTRIVDIHLTIDAMRMAYTDQIEILCIVSGDGDFVPLIEEVKRRGKMVVVAALDSGRNEKLKTSVDRFIDLNPILLTNKRDPRHEDFYREFYALLPKATPDTSRRHTQNTEYDPSKGIARRLTHNILAAVRNESEPKQSLQQRWARRFRRHNT